MDISLNITKYSNLIHNDGLSAFMGHAAQQNHNTYDIFYKFISVIKPVRILEIGTALGGFTKFLDIACRDLNLQTYIKSYDIHNFPWYNDINNNYTQIIVKNIFANDYNALIDLSIPQFIQDAGVTIVLCDGGCKKCEFNILSKYLKKDDIIMAHDYAPNTNYFQSDMNRKIWNWHEIQDIDIQESIQNNGLDPYMREKMLSVAWACFIKKE